MSMFTQLIVPDPPPREKREKPSPAPRPLKYEPIKNKWDLTPAQCCVLQFLCKGWTMPEIAVHMKISPKTVHTQLERARDRMEARSTLQAALMWAREMREAS